MKTTETIREIIADNERLKIELKATQQLLEEMYAERFDRLLAWADGLKRLLRITRALKNIDDERVQMKISEAWADTDVES
jgi:hypothetical protein